MPWPRMNTQRWMALVAAVAVVLSLALNVVLGSLFLSSGSRRPTRSASPAPAAGANVPPSDVAGVDHSARVVTRGLPRSVKAVLRGHPDFVSAVAYSADSSRIAVATEDGALTFWKVSGGRPRLLSEFKTEAIEPPDAPITQLAFSPDGRSVAFSRRYSPHSTPDIRLLDIDSGQSRSLMSDKVMELYSVGPTGMAFVPDGSALVVGFRMAIALLDVGNGQVRGVLQVSKQLYYGGFSFAPLKPTRLASKSVPSGVHVFDLKSMKTIRSLKGASRRPPGPQFVITALTPDGERVAASTEENGVFVWDVSAGKQVAGIEEGAGSGWTKGSCWTAFTADGGGLLTASRGSLTLGKNFARRRDPSTGELVAQMELIQPGDAYPYVYPRIFAPNGRTLAALGWSRDERTLLFKDSAVVLYDLSQILDESESSRR